MVAPARFAAAWREAAATGKLIPLDQGPSDVAPVASLRSPLRGFAARDDGSLHPNHYPPLSQQVDR